MNKQLFLLSFIVATIATLAVGCQKEEGTVTLGAEIQKTVGGNTKVYIDDHTPCWHNGDEVYINNAAYPVMAASGSSARIENVVLSSAYRAIFPAGIVPTGSDISSSSSVRVTLPSVQHYELVGNHQRVDVPMGAYITSGSTLQFYNLCSVVRVIVSNSLNQDLTLSRIELTSDTSKLSGAGIATVSNSVNDRIEMTSTASHTVTLNFGNNGTTVGALATESFDIVVPEFGTDDVTIAIYTTDDRYVEIEKENVELAHNTITTVTANVTTLSVAAELVNGYTFGHAIPGSVTSVVFECNSSVNSGTLLSTADSPIPIYGNRDGTVWRVSTSGGKIIANPNCSGMFYDMDNLISIYFGIGFNTSNVTNMSEMFNYCYELTYIDLAHFNTSNVTNMRQMFNCCRELTSLDVSHFNTSNVTNMSEMFRGCSSLTSLDLSNFNTLNVSTMSDMFSSCPSLTSLDISNFNTLNVTNMAQMFVGCSGLTSLYVSHFITTNVTSMYGMFSGCRSLTNLDLSGFNTQYVTDMSDMFMNCSGLTDLNLSFFNMSSVTSKANMCKNLSRTSCSCTITCHSSVEGAIKEFNPDYSPTSPYSSYYITGLPTSGVEFHWVRP